MSIAMAGFDWFMEENPDFDPFAGPMVENFADYGKSDTIYIPINELDQDIAAKMAYRSGQSIAALFEQASV